VTPEGEQAPEGVRAGALRCTISPRSRVIGGALSRVLAQVTAWLRHHDPERLTVSVNIAAQHLRHPGFTDGVLRCLQAHDLPPGLLQMEVTETGLISDRAEARDALRRLRGHGVRVAIDDFGTGQSSLAYLSEFSPDVVKLDKLFVHALQHGDLDAARLVSGVVQLAHSLDATVVAEGIETSEQLSALVALGCDTGQGFLLSPAVPADLVRLG
jgi:EAL domain-containing protein (putative c-di-GMP-specific phosphodiesterase class I)